MDWVETTGKTVDEAQQRALAHLGVALGDADVEILEQPTTGLFGRVRGEARVRARVRPAGPRPKRTHRPNRPEGRGSDRPRSNDNRSRQGSRSSSERGPRENSTNGNRGNERRNGANSERPPRSRPMKEENMAEGISLAEQGQLAKGFLEGLLSAMNLTAQVTIKEIDTDTVEVSVDAEPAKELGVLVGPRGTTLQALQEITRTFVQAKSPGRTDRILVDVARYRERRVAALGRFAQQIAQEVTETGEERALEPMSAADRKAVHDALTESSSVTTRSEGEEPRRFVVVAPA